MKNITFEANRGEHVTVSRSVIAKSNQK